MFENSLNINAPKLLNARVTLSINHCQLKMRRKMNKDDKWLLVYSERSLITIEIVVYRKFRTIKI